MTVQINKTTINTHTQQFLKLSIIYQTLVRITINVTINYAGEKLLTPAYNKSQLLLDAKPL